MPERTFLTIMRKVADYRTHAEKMPRVGNSMIRAADGEPISADAILNR
jgi:hypothetical protein